MTSLSFMTTLLLEFGLYPNVLSYYSFDYKTRIPLQEKFKVQG